MRFSSAIVGLVCSLSIVTTALPARAATGIAWDQVTKFSMGGSVPSPNFGPDFAAASQPPQSSQQYGGIMGGLMGPALGAMQMMQTGIAERHYVAGNLRRVDNVGQALATIIDCGARTITYLNLAKKTYRVVSMDQPSARGGPGGPRGSSSPAQDDGTRYKVAYNSQALGPKQIDGVNTDGYKATMTITMTRSNGDQQTFDTVMTEYLAGYAEPQQTCPTAMLGAGGMPAAAGPLAAMTSSMNITRMMSAAMRTPGGDSRFTFTSSGPPLPTGKLDLFSAWQLSAPQSQGRGITTIVERGNVRQVADTDKSIFGVPPDFTKET